MVPPAWLLAGPALCMDARRWDSFSSHGRSAAARRSARRRPAEARLPEGPHRPFSADLLRSQWTSRVTAWLHASATFATVTLTRKLYVVISVRPAISVLAEGVEHALFH